MEQTKKLNLITMYKTSAISVSTVLISLIAFFLFPLKADAATMSLSPYSGSYKVGQTFSVSVYVGSSDQAMNAVSGAVSFSRDVLEITSLSKSGSILNLWVQEPSFSNSNGSINFEGVVYNPGYTGNSGKILTVTFRAKAEGTASVSFSSGSVLANDGEGTNILTGLGKATFTIGPGTPVEKPPTTTIPLPTAPLVTSQTHPDSNLWYSHNDPRFEWSLTSDITNINIHTDHEPATDPGTTKADGRIINNTYTDIEDGTWYFHIQYQNARGWGPASHYRFQVDTHKPESFIITELPRTTTTDPIARFIFTATDTLSGIESYEVAIDTQAPQVWKDDGSHLYVAPVIGPGLHTLRAKAFDRAGNYFETSTTFTITPGQQVVQPIVTEVVKVPVEISRQSFIYTTDPVILIGIMILFILFVLLLVLLIAYLWFKFRYLRRHLHESPESIAELEQNLGKIFTVLRGKIEEYSLLVEKTRVKKKLAEHELAGEEDRILSDFKKYLDSAEGIMKKHFKK